MNVFMIIRLIGLVCWLWHTASHVVIASATDPETGRTTKRCFCPKCDQHWEVEE